MEFFLRLFGRFAGVAFGYHIDILLHEHIQYEHSDIRPNTPLFNLRGHLTLCI